jgi:hypothetical protein
MPPGERVRLCGVRRAACSGQCVESHRQVGRSADRSVGWSVESDQLYPYSICICICLGSGS